MDAIGPGLYEQHPLKDSACEQTFAGLKITQLGFLRPVPETSMRQR